MDLLESDLRAVAVRRRARALAVAAVLGGLLGATLSSARAADRWAPQASGTTARLRGVSVVSDRVAWASGSQGTVVSTLDGGATWQARTVPGASVLDFRDIHAVDGRTVYLLSIGEGELSRVYKTTDAGATWELMYMNRDPKGFLDAVAFWDAHHSIVVGDPVDGRFTILTTDDGGKTWNQPAAEGMPAALAGEGAFAASGTCLAVQGDRNAWFGTGGAAAARVFRSTDRGRTWTVHETPIRPGNASSGIFSMAFRDESHGVAVGGDYRQPDLAGRHVSRTTDGGRTWTAPPDPQALAFRSAVAQIPGTRNPTFVAVGPSGSDLSTDDGVTWSPLGKLGFHAVGFAGRGVAGWAVGAEGVIARFLSD